MKKLIWLITAFIFAILLTSCCETCNQSIKQPNWVHENWMRQVNTNPRLWTAKADSWFFNGIPNKIEREELKAPRQAAITHTSVRVNNFTKIVTSGSYQLQIVGGQESNSVSIFGENAGTQQISVHMSGKTLYLYQTSDPRIDLCKVIVRIGIRHLHLLINNGAGNVYGRDIRSNGLAVVSNGFGNTYLSGPMNLVEVTQNGPGTIAILGAWATHLTVTLMGSGMIGICGRLGVRCIKNFGTGCVNLIGADSDGLDIEAQGASTTTVVGYVNLKQVFASGHSHIFLYWVNGQDANITERDDAVIGLAGYTTILHATVTDDARLEAEYLRSSTAYVRTFKAAHANVNTKDTLFTEAKDESVIYFFGPPNILPKIPSMGNVIPMYHNKALFCMPTPRPDAWNVTGCPRIPFLVYKKTF